MISDGYLGRPCSDFLSKCIKHLNLDEKIFLAAQGMALSFRLLNFFPDVCKSEKFNCVIRSFGYQKIVSHKNGINELNEIFSV